MVLRDGGTAVLRPIHPDDAERLVAFYGRVSDESKYLRFFAPYPNLSASDIERFTRVDHRDRVALIVTVGAAMIAVGRFDRIEGDEAEAAFLVEDAQQGRGIGGVLLEHLAQAAREIGIRRFTAEVMPGNQRMLVVFGEAGYQVAGGYEDGVVHLELAIEPTDSSLEVSRARERRAEARSVERLLTPRSVAVVGASRSRDKVGQTLVRNLVLSGYTGPVYAVNPVARAVAGVPAYADLRDVPGPVDLAVVAVPAEVVRDVVLACAEKGVSGLVVVASGFAETGEPGRARQRELVRVARAYGLRVVGPNALGMINTDPEIALNASLSAVMPAPGRVGFFCQSGALGTVILSTLADRGLGLSTFVSAGNRADVSGNDLLQFWQEDPATEVVLLYLESIGNPRKFSRIARRLARDKPVVAVRSGRATQGVPVGHTVRRAEVPSAAIDAMFAQAGVILVDTLDEMLDVAQILANQPLPAGPRLAVVGNSDALGLLAVDAAVEAGLRMGRDPVDLGPEANAADFGAALERVYADEEVDAIVSVYVSPVAVEGRQVASVIARTAARGAKPVVATFLGTSGVPEPLRHYDEQGVAVRGSVPSYSSPEHAVHALAKVVPYVRWREQPVGRLADPDGVDAGGAREVVDATLAEASAPAPGSAGSSAGSSRSTRMDSKASARLLRCYGIDLWPVSPIGSVEEAIDAGERLGWDVVLKATAPHLRQRADLADVWRNIDDAEAMREAWSAMVATIGEPGAARYVVQRMAPPGVPVTVGAVTDPLFGPLVSFGVAGVATDLLGDRAYRIPPLTDRDAASMIREIRAAPLLFGHRGGDRADVSAVEDLVLRVAQLAYDVPELVVAELVPVLAGGGGVAVLGAHVVVRPADSTVRPEEYARRMTRL